VVFISYADLDCDPPIYASHIAGRTGTCHPCYFLRWGPATFFAWAFLLCFVFLLTSAFSIAGITEGSHLELPIEFKNSRRVVTPERLSLLQLTGSLKYKC
jgi:hypothetical protein